MRVALDGPINPSSVTRAQHTIEKQIRDHGTNFIALVIDSPGGTLADSMNLANFLADQDPAQVRIVAYVPREARSDAALVALAADQLVMDPEAVLGGEGEVDISPEDAKLVRETIRDGLAKKKARSWSLLAALVDPELRSLQLHESPLGERSLLLRGRAGRAGRSRRVEAGGRGDARG